MKKLLSLSLMLSLGLATVTPALNAVAESQQDAVAQSQANPAHVSGWQAAKKWWQSGRNMKVLSKQEKKAFRALKRRFTIGAIIAAIVAMIGGGAAYLHRKTAADHLGRSLRIAAIVGNDAEVERLIRARADVNAADQDGWTALMDAAKRGHENIVKMLLQVEGIDVNAAGPGGFTALMFAAARGYEKIVEMLLQVEEIDVNTASQSGNTALMLAGSRGNKNIVKMLLDAKADKNLKNFIGKTAENMARNDEIANMIRDYVKDK